MTATVSWSGVRRRIGRSARLGAVVVAGTLLPVVAPGTPVAAAGPAPCVPFGTAQIPPGYPSAGGDAGFDQLPQFFGPAPGSVELRSQTTGFNKFWEFALVGPDLLARPRFGGQDHAQPWRYVPMPECMRGTLAGISADDDELVAVDHDGWIYTMDNASQFPLLWNWTSAFGSPFWFGSGRTVPGSRDPGTWSLSVASPFDNQTYTDIAGRVHFHGSAKMTMVPALTGDGSRITFADPWLPNDDSSEIGGPLGGRFKASHLSAAGSTTFVMNDYGDMYTRNFDYDSSGSDSVFFPYRWDDQGGKPSAPNATLDSLPLGEFAAVQLPAPDWVHQPKIPGEITSTISVHSTGVGPGQRELRVEGCHDGATGFWHKMLDAPAWEFTPTGEAALGTPVQNPSGDHSNATLAPAAPWNLSGTLPIRDNAVSGVTLNDLSVPYSLV